MVPTPVSSILLPGITWNNTVLDCCRPFWAKRLCHSFSPVPINSYLFVCEPRNISLPHRECNQDIQETASSSQFFVISLPSSPYCFCFHLFSVCLLNGQVIFTLLFRWYFPLNLLLFFPQVSLVGTLLNAVLCALNVMSVRCVLGVGMSVCLLSLVSSVWIYKETGHPNPGEYTNRSYRGRMYAIGLVKMMFKPVEQTSLVN